MSITRLGLRALTVLAVFLAGCGGGGSSGTPAPSALSYASPQVFVVGHAVTPVTPTVMGTVSSYTISPGLPAGLVLNGTSGVISGTPTAIAAAANYAVTAQNSAGSTSAHVSIAVTDIPPASVGYPSSKIGYSVGVAGQTVTPTAGGGAVVSWSIAPDLPAGLTFSTTDGSISGTPAAASPATTYVVSAQNSGGSSTFNLILTVEGVFLELGHSYVVSLLQADTQHVLSEDQSGHWNLWNATTRAMLAAGDSGCNSDAHCDLQGNTRVAAYPLGSLAGTTFVITTPTGLEVRSSTDGHLLSTISTPLSWWRLAADGSYIAGGTSTALTVWSPAGAVTFAHAGDYSGAKAFAAAAEVRVALGAGGQNVIETIAVPAGTAALSPTFTGSFHSWFVDGEKFLSSFTLTVYTNSKAGALLDTTMVSSLENLQGSGNWLWIFPSSTTSTLTIYKVGASSTASATYTLGSGTSPRVIPSGTTLGAIANDRSASVIDLSGASLVKTDYAPVPIGSLNTYAATSASQWWAGSGDGVVLDGSALPATPMYFNYGAVASIAGSSSRIAVATSIGKVLLFDTTTGVQQGTVPFGSFKIQLSADGTLLAAMGGGRDLATHQDYSVNLYPLPSTTPLATWPNTTGALPYAVDIALAKSGTTFGQVLLTSTGFSRQVTAVPGGSSIWSDTLGGNSTQIVPIRLSPDGTLIAASTGVAAQTTGTNIYKNGSLVTAVPGWALGWIDDNHLFVNNYMDSQTLGPQYSGCSIFDATGAPSIACPKLPLASSNDIQTVTSSSVYSAGVNTIYALPSGTVTWLSANPSLSIGTVAGPRIVFVSGARVLAQTY